MNGNLIIVSAPSGAGKTTLAGEVIKRVPGVKASISYTSRPPRPAEIDGVHYHFVTLDQFEGMIERGEFLEWARVHGNLYGTSRHQVEAMWSDGFDVILTIDVQGADQARRLFPDCIMVFILPPSFQTLIDRLGGRGANHDEDLRVRLHNAVDEISKHVNFDYIVVNDELNHATEELAAIVIAERCRGRRRAEIVERILKTFSRTSELN